MYTGSPACFVKESKIAGIANYSQSRGDNLFFGLNNTELKTFGRLFLYSYVNENYLLYCTI